MEENSRLKNFTSENQESMEQEMEVKNFDHNMEVRGKEILPQEEIRGKKNFTARGKKI